MRWLCCHSSGDGSDSGGSSGGGSCGGCRGSGGVDSVVVIVGAML